jgi:hypothetical protein
MANNGQGVNYKKTQHDFVNFGTPAIHPLVVVRNDEGDFTGHADNDSDFHKVMAILQTRMEIYAVGAVSGTTFTLMVVDNTLAADDGNERAPTSTPDLDFLQNEVSNGCGIGVRIYNGKISGTSINYDDC